MSNRQQAIILTNAGKANMHKYTSPGSRVLMKCDIENSMRRHSLKQFIMRLNHLIKFNLCLPVDIQLKICQQLFIHTDGDPVIFFKPECVFVKRYDMCPLLFENNG